MNIRQAHVRIAAAEFIDALKALGMVDKDAWVTVYPGSAQSQRSWAVRETQLDENSKQVPVHTWGTAPGVDLVGVYTNREAYQRLTAATVALRAVIDYQKGRNEL